VAFCPIDDALAINEMNAESYRERSAMEAKAGAAFAPQKRRKKKSRRKTAAHEF